MVELQLEASIKKIQSNCGGEYCSFVGFLHQNGILFPHPCPHTHQQYGRAERKHHHITETDIALLAWASLRFEFWWHAFHTVVFLINRLPSSILGGLSPFVKLFSKKPDYLVLQPFECASFPHLRPYLSHKLNFHFEECVFIDYSSALKGYLCLNPTGRIFISRNVIFHPLDFPSTSKFVSSSSTSQPSSLPSITTTFTMASTQTLPPLFNSSSSLVVPTTPPSTQVPRSPVFALASNSSPSSNIHPMTTHAKAGIFKPI